MNLLYQINIEKYYLIMEKIKEIIDEKSIDEYITNDILIQIIYEKN